MPHDLPSTAVYRQMRRWLAAESFADMAGDLRAVLRMAGGAGAGAVCGDEKPQIQATIRTAPVLPMRPGPCERRMHVC